MTDVPAYLMVLFAVLFVSVLLWLGLVSTLYRRLASTYPDKYREMGEPGLISNNRGLGQSVRLMKFIFTREDRPLNDPQVSRLTAFMFGFFICLVVVLLFSMIRVLLMTPGLRGS